jgi:cytoskeletal protein RodZ
MSERSLSRVAAAVLLVSAVVLGAGTAASVDATQASTQQTAMPAIQQQVDTDSVRLVVSVDRNGSASWTVQYWTRLDDDNTTAAFESLRADIESSPSNYSDRFASRMRRTVDTAENATDREMAATDFTVRAETRTPPQYGVVSYTFQWENFAATTDETIRVGDAIEGLFLDDRTRLVVEWPADYVATRVTPAPDERRSDAVVWRGTQTSFVSGEPTLVLVPSAAATTTAAGGTDGNGGETGGTDPTAGAPETGPGPLSAVGLVLLFVVFGAFAWRYRGRADSESSSDSTGEADANVDAEDDALADSDTATSGEGGGPDSSSSEDLLSNEERVLQFVRDEGGRVKQQAVVEAFDWTEARTSQIVRDLRDDGQLDGFRLGRENVLKLPDEE